MVIWEYWSSTTAMMNTTEIPLGLEFENDDAAWIMACTFIIFTMQTGFGLMESGMCSMKNEVNIMAKNVVDVALGGLAFWALGYGLLMGDYSANNEWSAFFGSSNFFFDPDINQIGSGESYLHFFQQVAFVSSSTTIASGAMAERCNFHAYCIFATLNVFIYALPAHWIWGPGGWLKEMGAVDLAGSGVVHALGGVSALVGAKVLGPRLGVRRQRQRVLMGNSQNSLVGLFIIWWASLAFNSGSTFGVSNSKWMFASKATVMTMIASFGGGSTSLLLCYVLYKGKIRVTVMIYGVFASLVSITASCYVVSALEALFIGIIASLLAFITELLMDKYIKIDDAVAAFPVHGVPGIWGLIALGFFAKKDERLGDLLKFNGLLHEGDLTLLGVQCLTAIVIVAWTTMATFALLRAIDTVTPLRSGVIEELLGQDYSHHDILHVGVGVEKAVDVLRHVHDHVHNPNVEPAGKNLGHTRYMEENYNQRFQDAVSRRASLHLAALFGVRGEVSSADVDAFEASHKQQMRRDTARRSDRGAFGRTNNDNKINIDHSEFNDNNGNKKRTFRP